MYKFDVKYTFDNYLEYYKFVLIKQRILRDLVFALFFVGIAVYWWIEFLTNFCNYYGTCFPNDELHYNSNVKETITC